MGEMYMVVKMKRSAKKELAGVVVKIEGDAGDRLRTTLVQLTDETSGEVRVIAEVQNVQDIRFADSLGDLLLSIGWGILLLGNKTAMIPDESATARGCREVLLAVERTLRAN